MSWSPCILSWIAKMSWYPYLLLDYEPVGCSMQLPVVSETQCNIPTSPRVLWKPFYSPCFCTFYEVHAVLWYTKFLPGISTTILLRKWHTSRAIPTKRVLLHSVIRTKLSSSTLQGFVQLLPNGDRAPELRFYQYQLISKSEGKAFHYYYHNKPSFLTITVNICRS